MDITVSHLCTRSTAAFTCDAVILMNISSDAEQNATVLTEERAAEGRTCAHQVWHRTRRKPKGRRDTIRIRSTVKARASRHGYHTNLAQRVIGGIPTQISNGTGCTRGGTISLTHPLPLDDEGKERESAPRRTYHRETHRRLTQRKPLQT